MGMFIRHLPVTTLQSRLGGRSVWNAPKFVADMDFEETAETRGVRLFEEGRDILTLNVRRGGWHRVDRSPQVWYSSRDGRLTRTELPQLASVRIRLGHQAGSLELGDHPVAQDIARLGIELEPLMAMDYLVHHAALPAPETLGTAQAYDGWLGGDRKRGRFTVSYFGAATHTIYPASDQASDAHAAADIVPAAS